MRRNPQEPQENFRAKRQEVLKSITETFTLTNEVFGSIGANMYMTERATRLNCGEELEVELKSLAKKRYKNCQAVANLIVEHAELPKLAAAAKELVDARVKKARNGHSCDLDALRNSFKACARDLLQEHDE